MERECPEYAAADPILDKRASTKDHFLHIASINVEKNLYNNLLELFIKCREAREGGVVKATTKLTTKKRYPTTTRRTTRRPITTRRTTRRSTTTRRPTTKSTPTSISDKEACRSSKTITLSESWRNSNKVILPKDKRHDDTEMLNGQTWFRFTGAAGIQLKNTCPLFFGCGSGAGYWSDSLMPTRVGQTNRITMYESWAKKFPSVECKLREFNATVTRCSAKKGDLVYQMNEGMSGGADTVCGMN